MSNGGPFAPFGSPRRQSEPVKGMTKYRQAVLAKIRTYASRSNPLRLGGHEGRAARWLAARGFVEMIHDGAFAPMVLAAGFDEVEVVS